MKTRTCLFGLVLGLAACGQTPTAAVAPADLRFNGMTMGGGLAVPGQQSTTTSSGTSTTTDTCSEELRGGMTMGGGLYTEPEPCPEPEP